MIATTRLDVSAGPPRDSGAPGPRIRQRAAAIVARADGKVLLHRQEHGAFWALPGGAIEPGESASEAITRELHEELDTTVALGALGLVVENFFHHQGEAVHEIGLYLHASPQPGSRLALSEGPYEGTEGDRKLFFAWFSRDELASLDVRPACLRAALAQIHAFAPGATAPAEVVHIVNRDAPLPAATIVDAPAQGPGPAGSPRPTLP